MAHFNDIGLLLLARLSRPRIWALLGATLGLWFTIHLVVARPEALSRFSVQLWGQNYSGQGGWGSDKTAWDTEKTPSQIGFDGCFLTSYAMILNYYQPGFTNPGVFNTCLKKHTRTSYFGQDAKSGDPIRECWPDSVTQFNKVGDYRGISCAAQPDECLEPIKQSLRNHQPVLAILRSKVSPTKRHAVVITEREGSTYHINDPLGISVSDNGRRRTIDESILFGKGADNDVLLEARLFSGPVPSAIGSVRVRYDLQGRSSSGTGKRSNFSIVIRDWGSGAEVFRGSSSTNDAELSDQITVPNLSQGMYSVWLKPDHYTSREFTLLLAGRSPTIDFAKAPARPCGEKPQDQPITVFCGGDTDNNDRINALDTSRIIADLGMRKARSDINADGTVNTLDWSLARQSYGAVGAWRSFAMAANSVGAYSSSGASARMFVDVDRRTVRVGDTVHAVVDATTDGALVDSIEAEIRYDPSVLRFDKIEAGGVLPRFTYAVDQKLGVIRAAALAGPSDAAVKGYGVLARIDFTAVAAVESTVLDLVFDRDSGLGSQVVEASSVASLLSSTQDRAVTIDGSPARAILSGRFLTPSGPYLESTVVPVAVEAKDPSSQVRTVKFEVYYDSRWNRIGTDTDGADGWSIDWTPDSFFWNIPEERSSKLRFRATLETSGSLKSVIDAAGEFGFAAFDFVPGEIIVKTRAGADIHQITRRVSGDAGKVRESFADGEYVIDFGDAVSINYLDEWVRRFTVDADVEYAQFNYIYYTYDHEADYQALSRGWNLIAPSIVGSGEPIRSALSELSGLYDRVYTFDPGAAGNAWRFFAPDEPPLLNDLDRLEAGTGLWVHMVRPAVLATDGITREVRALVPGWNLVGAPGNQPTTMQEVERLTNGRIRAALTFDPERVERPWLTYTADGDPSNDDFDSMLPPHAYWVNVAPAAFTWHGNDSPQQTEPELSFPSLPMRVHGQFEDPDGERHGAVAIEARSATGTLVATRATVTEDGGEFRFDIPADDPLTAAIDGARENERIILDIDGIPVAQTTWRSGEFVEARLSLTRQRPRGQPLFLPLVVQAEDVNDDGCLMTEREPNGAVNQAKVNPELCADVTVPGALPLGDDIDLYRIEVTETSIVRALVTSLPRDGTFEFDLLDSAGSSLGPIVAKSDATIQLTRGVPAGSYYIALRWLSGGRASSYALRWLAEPHVGVLGRDE